MSVASLRRAARETVSGLPREFWWLWTSTLINRLGAFVATFMALYLTLDRGYSASYAGLVASLHGLGGVVSSIGAGMHDRPPRPPPHPGHRADVDGRCPSRCSASCTDPVAIAAVALLVGMASNASRPAVQAMMADIVRPRGPGARVLPQLLGDQPRASPSRRSTAGFIAQYSYLAGFLGEATLTLVCAIVVFAQAAGVAPRAARRSEKEAEPQIGIGTVLRDGRFMGVVACPSSSP